MKITALLRFAWRAGRTWFGRLPAPYKLTFSITSRCNLRCASCNIWNQKIDDELSTEEIDKFFRCNPDIYWLDLTGGEVMLRPDLPDILASAARHLPHLFQLHFPCNGTLPERTGRITESVVARGIPKVVVSVSMDGPPELHDELRGKHGTWDRAVETYKRIKGISGAEVYFGMTVTHKNLSRIVETVDALSESIPKFGPRDLHLNIAHDTFYYGHPDIVALDPQAVEQQLARFSRWRGVPTNPVLLLEWLYQRRVPEYLRTGKSPIRCQALSSSLFITSRGDVYPCTSYERKLGSLRETDYELSRIWDLECSKELALEIRNGRCPGCWTPCEAYQSIIAALPRKNAWIRGDLGKGM